MSHPTAQLVAASVTLGAVLATAAMLLVLAFAHAAGSGQVPQIQDRGPRVTVVSASDLAARTPRGLGRERGQVFDSR